MEIYGVNIKQYSGYYLNAAALQIGIWRAVKVRGWLGALPPALVRVALHAVNQNFNDCRGQSYLD